MQSNQFTTSYKTEILLLFTILTILLVIAFNTDTTGDNGDSITHYLFSHYAFTYPRLFFDHWAKPVFVLFSAPFAQFGFKGIIVFNCLCASLTAFFTSLTARNLNVKNHLLVFVLLFFAPLYFLMIFSGLTEYFFALVLTLGIYFATLQKNTVALMIVSFLPLIRSEGLLIVAVFAIYTFINKKYRLLPYLLTGQAVYSLAGAFYYKDILWVFTKIPYAKIENSYGHGSLFDFVHKLNFAIEKPIYLLFAIGVCGLLYSVFQNKFKNFEPIKIILLFGSFSAIFVAHSIFWWLGIFKSMGMVRVLIVVIPSIIVISMIGIQTFSEKIKNPILKHSIMVAIVLLICIYPFTNRSQGIVYKRDMFVLTENRFIEAEVAPFIKKEFPDYKNHRVYCSHPYFWLSLKIDIFNPNIYRELLAITTDEISKNSIVIWDDWFGRIEAGISLETLQNDNRFELIKTFEKQDKERTIKYAIFKVKTSAK